LGNDIGETPGGVNIGGGPAGVSVAANSVELNGNRIRNATNGIFVTSGRLNRMTVNSTFAVTNGYLLTPGTNDDIESPSLLDALLDDHGATLVTGYFEGAPNTTYYLQFFVSDAVCTESGLDAVGFGQFPVGERVSITTDAAGRATIDTSFTDSSARAGRSLNVVADSAAGPGGPSNTSTHSNCQAL
jgi:hypothetical protein